MRFIQKLNGVQNENVLDISFCQCYSTPIVRRFDRRLINGGLL